MSVPELNTAQYALTVAEAARLAGISVRRARLYRQIEILEPMTIDGKHAVTRASLERLIAERCRVAAARKSSRRAAKRGYSALRLVVDNS